MSIQSEINDAIETSIEVLNAIDPYWLASMPTNLRYLDVMDTRSCPLFYVFGDFWTGICVIDDAGFESSRLAFTALWEWEDLSWQERDAACDELRVAWRNRIAELRD